MTIERTKHGSAHQPRVVLASTSRYRRALIERLGIPYLCRSPEVDEDAVKRVLSAPLEVATTLATAKARAVAGTVNDALVIGCDQVATIDGEILDKPGDEETALRMLQRLAGRTHELITAMCVIDTRDGREHHNVSLHELTMRHFDEAQLRAYIRRDLPLDCSGSYRMEALGCALFAHVRGDDPTAIEGMPMFALCGILMEHGVDLLSATP